MSPVLDDVNGWDWFDAAAGPGSESDGGEAWQALSETAARCFRGEDGRRLLDHLRRVTIERILAPEVSDARLRHAEGQRQIVRYLETLIATGRAGKAGAGPRPNPEQENQNHD